MSAIFKKWKFLIIGGIILVILAYTLDPIVEFALKAFEHSANSTQFSPHWQRFTNRDDGYIVEFPAKPFEQSDASVMTNPAAISFHQFFSVLGSNNCFGITTTADSFTNYHFTTNQINLILDTTVKGALGSGDKLISKRDIMFGTNFGREIEVQKTNGYFLKARFYKIGNRLQNLIVSMPVESQQMQATNVSYFFNSFNLVTK